MASSDLIAKAKKVAQLRAEGHIEAALGGAEALAVEYPGAVTALCLLGEIHFVAAIRAREAAAGSEEDPADAASRSKTHLLRARGALSEAKELAPDNFEIAAGLADFLIESGMYSEAEAEYRRALELDIATAARTVVRDVNNPFSSTPHKRMQACQLLANRLVAHEVDRILEIGKTEGGASPKTDDGAALKTEGGAALTTNGGVALMTDGGVALKTDGLAQKLVVPAFEMVKEAKSLANRFPDSARAQLCLLFARLKHMRSLPRDLDMSKGVECLVRSAGSVAQSFPNSAVISLFNARLLLLSGRLDVAEAECHRGLFLKEASDPEEDCVPPGSIKGDQNEERLRSVAEEIHCLLKQVIHRAENFWENSLTVESKQSFMSVRIDVLQEQYNKVDKSHGFKVTSALSFFKENKSWKFWLCPFCNSNKKHTRPAALLEHMCKKHPRLVLPSLKSIVDSTLQLESDGLLDGVCLSQDPGKHDIIRFEEKTGMFWWLFSEPSRGEKARPFDNIKRENLTEGTKLLQSIKMKMSSLPADTSAADKSPELHEIRHLWFQFLNSTAFDYGKLVLTLARTFLWSEFKKHMAGGHKSAGQNITADDVDAIFCTWSDVAKEAMKEEVSDPTDCQRSIMNLNVGETPNVSIDQEAGDILSLNSEDTDLMDIILRTLWSLRHFTAQVIKREALCSKNKHDGPCISDMVHRTFCSWENNEYHREELSSLANALHQILDDDDRFQKDQINFISDISFATLNGLHLPDACLHLGFIGDMLAVETTAFLCKYHYSIGMKYLMHMSCGCLTCSSEKHDADPIMVEELCRQCCSAVFMEEPHSIIAVHWSNARGSRETLAESLKRWLLEPVMTFHYKTGIAYYRLAAMICYLDGTPVGLAQSETCWIVYSGTQELRRYEGPWEGFLDMCRNCRPGVLFYEVIK